MWLPDKYVSQATLLVVQQQVSQRYVEPDNVTTIPAAVQAMKLEVLSRARLITIITDLGLYASARPRLEPDLLVERMRKEIDIQPLETTPGRADFNAFTIAFTASNPSLAQAVTSRLTSLFIEQNLKTQGEQAANTTKFLTDQLEAAKQRLAEQEERLQAFKTTNLGELPEQQQANLAALTEIRDRLTTVSASLLQVQDQRAMIESSLNDRLVSLQSERRTLLSQYTPQHPTVLSKEREIGRIQSTLDRLKAGRTESEGPAAAEVVDDPTLAVTLRDATESNASTRTATCRDSSRLRLVQTGLHESVEQETPSSIDNQFGTESGGPTIPIGRSSEPSDKAIGTEAYQDCARRTCGWHTYRPRARASDGDARHVRSRREGTR